MITVGICCLVIIQYNKRLLSNLVFSFALFVLCARVQLSLTTLGNGQKQTENNNNINSTTRDPFISIGFTRNVSSFEEANKYTFSVKSSKLSPKGTIYSILHTILYIFATKREREASLSMNTHMYANTLPHCSVFSS